MQSQSRLEAASQTQPGSIHGKNREWRVRGAARLQSAGKQHPGSEAKTRQLETLQTPEIGAEKMGGGNV